MRINRARDVLLDPVARATLDEELARRRRESAPPGPGANGTSPTPSAPSASRDRRWRAEWGSDSPWTTPPAGSDAPGPVPPPASPVRPSANRLRHFSRPGRRANPVANPALSARQRSTPNMPPAEAKTTPRPRPANPQPAPSKPARPQAVPPQAAQPPTAQPPKAPQPQAAQAAPSRPAQRPPAGRPKASAQPTPSPTEKPATAWSLYAVPLDGVSVAALVASLIMCGPLGFVLGIIGLARTADDKRRGRWAAVAGIAIGSLTTLVAIGYVMQAMSAPAP